jgi:Na+-driven multidrug efflux pump
MASRKFHFMFHRLLRAEEQSRAAKTVEVFGWLILAEGAAILFAPQFVASLLHLPPLTEQAANYLRLAGLLVCGVGMLYVASGRLNAEGFVFASLLDRPLVPIAMGILWHLDIIPGPLALIFSIEDFGSFLWTLITWSRE